MKKIYIVLNAYWTDEAGLNTRCEVFNTHNEAVEYMKNDIQMVLNEFDFDDTAEYDENFDDLSDVTNYFDLTSDDGDRFCWEIQEKMI